MGKIEDKLKELGYEYDKYVYWVKDKIYLYMSPIKTITEKWCFVKVNLIIQNRNDIQALKDSIDYYHEQLMTMQKDLEVLKEYEKK